jgi:hypothetical protein
MRISCGQEPRWYRVNVLDVGREHLGRCIAAAAAVGTLTAVHDAYYSGSPRGGRIPACPRTGVVS